MNAARRNHHGTWNNTTALFTGILDILYMETVRSGLMQNAVKHNKAIKEGVSRVFFKGGQGR